MESWDWEKIIKMIEFGLRNRVSSYLWNWTIVCVALSQIPCTYCWCSSANLASALTHWDISNIHLWSAAYTITYTFPPAGGSRNIAIFHQWRYGVTSTEWFFPISSLLKLISTPSGTQTSSMDCKGGEALGGEASGGGAGRVGLRLTPESWQVLCPWCLLLSCELDSVKNQ